MYIELMTPQKRSGCSVTSLWSRLRLDQRLPNIAPSWRSPGSPGQQRDEGRRRGRVDCLLGRHPSTAPRPSMFSARGFSTAYATRGQVAAQPAARRGQTR